VPYHQGNPTVPQAEGGLMFPAGWPSSAGRGIAGRPEGGAAVHSATPPPVSPGTHWPPEDQLASRPVSPVTPTLRADGQPTMPRSVNIPGRGVMTLISPQEFRAMEPLVGPPRAPAGRPHNPPPIFDQRDVVIGQGGRAAPFPGIGHRESRPMPRQPVMVKHEPLARVLKTDVYEDAEDCKPGGLFAWRQRDASPASSSGADSTSSACQRLTEEAAALRALLDATLADSAQKGLHVEMLENAALVRSQELREARELAVNIDMELSRLAGLQSTPGPGADMSLPPPAGQLDSAGSSQGPGTAGSYVPPGPTYTVPWGKRSAQTQSPPAMAVDLMAPHYPRRDGDPHKYMDDHALWGDRSQDRPKQSRPHLEKFSGTSKHMVLDTFETHVRNVSELYGWDEAQTFLETRCALVDAAADCTADVTERTWPALRERLRARFQPAGQTNLHRFNLKKLRRGKEQSLSDFSTEVEKLGKLAFPLVPAASRDSLLVERFVDGVGMDNLSLLLCNAETSDLNTALQLAQRIEAADPKTDLKSAPGKPVVRRADTSAGMDAASIAAEISKLIGAPETGEPKQYRFRRDQTPGDRRGLGESSQSGGGRDRSWSRGRQDSRDRGRDTRPRDSQNQRDRGRDNRDRDESRGRERSQDRRRDDSRDRSRPRERSSSGDRPPVTCHKCYGMGHVIAECGSKKWYGADGRVRDKSPNPRGGATGPAASPR